MSLSKEDKKILQTALIHDAANVFARTALRAANKTNISPDKLKYIILRKRYMKLKNYFKPF